MNWLFVLAFALAFAETPTEMPPINIQDINQFHSAIEAQKRLNLASRAANYVRCLEQMEWNTAGWRDEWLQALDEAKYAQQCWSLLATANFVIENHNQAGCSSYARSSLSELRHALGRENYELGRMPTLPEGAFWTDDRISQTQWVEWLNQDWIPLKKFKK